MDKGLVVEFDEPYNLLKADFQNYTRLNANEKKSYRF
jgi:hypothetical protein